MEKHGITISKKVDRSKDILGEGWVRNPHHNGALISRCSNRNVHVPGECDSIIGKITVGSLSCVPAAVRI